MDIDLEQLRALMRAIDEFDVQELEIEREGERVVLRRGPGTAAAPVVAAHPGATAPPPAQPAAAATGAPQPQAPQAAEEEDDDITYVTSPFVGTFYRAPSPSSKAYVDKGTEIEPGQTLCIVEAMKLMNEIESEISGKIVDILVDNGKPVEYGDRLFKVRLRS